MPGSSLAFASCESFLRLLGPSLASPFRLLGLPSLLDPRLVDSVPEEGPQLCHRLVGRVFEAVRSGV